jgi:hypothetical protein
MKIDGFWGGNSDPARPATYEQMPSHSPHKVPDGGNQLQIDGSASWIKFKNMYFLHSWSPSTRGAYFYQNPSDFDPDLLVVLPLLRATP